ncbi:hypothetical protein ACMA5I_11220 [Paracoccaceae bacterium GXU_MW_L88]
MIRAHLASFPPRANILAETVRSILPQVDHLFVALNGYAAVPEALTGPKITAVIPERDLMDTGKFAFPPAPEDVVFTIDDDILYPPDYVETTLAQAREIGLEENVFGYQGHAWIFKKAVGREGWRNFMFRKPLDKVWGATILGTGTVCCLGKNLPSLDDVACAGGFVDLAFSAHQIRAGRKMWVLPRGADHIRNNLPEALEESALFRTHARSGHPEIRRLTRWIVQNRPDNSGLHHRAYLKSRQNTAGQDAKNLRKPL